MKLLLEETVRAALREDLGRAGDITTAATISPGVQASGTVVARKAGVIAGMPWVVETMRQVDGSIDCDVRVEDGSAVNAGTVLARVSGSAAGLLIAERTALNFLGHLSGVATATRKLVDAVTGTKAKIVDTRKTTPGLRALEKYAVRMGGGQNHRMGLDDAVLIKDNHILAAGGVRAAIERTKAAVGHMVTVECEVENLAQLDEALSAQVDAVLLDNMDPETLREAVAFAAGRAILEASGGITLETVRAVAETGVDLISAGWITHSAPNLDVALDFDP